MRDRIKLPTAVLGISLLTAGTLAMTGTAASAAAVHAAGSTRESCEFLRVKLIKLGHITGYSVCTYQDYIPGRQWVVKH